MYDIVQVWTQKQTHVQPFLLHPWIDRLNVSTKPFEGNLRKKNKKTKNNYCVVYRKTNPNKSPTQTKLHSEQCPGPLMEAAQLVSKAHLLMVSAEVFLTHPRTLLQPHPWDSSLCATFPQGNLLEYPRCWLMAKQTKSFSPPTARTPGQIYTNMTNGYKWHH